MPICGILPLFGLNPPSVYRLFLSPTNSPCARAPTSQSASSPLILTKVEHREEQHVQVLLLHIPSTLPQVCHVNRHCSAPRICPCSATNMLGVRTFLVETHDSTKLRDVCCRCAVHLCEPLVLLDVERIPDTSFATAMPLCIALIQRRLWTTLAD